MIINGGSRSNWRFFAKHLVKTVENEQVHLTEIRGLAAETVLEAFREMDALASGTRCKNFFYHANLNPRADEHLSPDQWEKAIDTLEEQLGLTGHSRFVVEHQKEGRCHRHVIWSRIDTDTMTATSDSNNYQAHERAARTLEKEFGLATVGGAHDRDGPRPDRRPKNWETFRGHESGIDPADVTRQVTDLWNRADSGKAFVASLAEQGFQLCRGDRRDFCIVDPAGDVHSLARRIEGAKAATVRARLADLDAASLPSIPEASANPLAVPVATTAPAEPGRAEPSQGATLPPPDPEPVAVWAENAPPRMTLGSALDAFAHKVTETMRSNHGELHHHDGFSRLDRAIAVIDMVAQAASWVRGKWQDMFERIGFHPPPSHDREDRDRDHDFDR